MRLELLLRFEEPFIIPYNYPRPLYSFIIHTIEFGDPRIARRIHNNKKDIKFVASTIRPVGKVRKTENGLLVESGKVKLLVGSPAWPVLEALINGLALGVGRLHILGMKLLDVDIKHTKTPRRLAGRKLTTLSPVNVYHNNPPNGFKQWDLSPVGQRNSPFENEPEVWKELVFENLKSKYLMVYGEPYEGDFEIKVLSRMPKSKRFFMKRDEKTGEPIYARAWDFRFKMWGEEEFLRVAYDLGLGMRNPHGFGMVEVHDHRHTKKWTS